MIKVVLLDVDNTLLDFELCAKASMHNGFAEWGLPFSDAAFDVFTRINDALWAQIERGALTREALFAQRWNLIFSALGLHADGEAFERRFLALLNAAAEPVEGAEALLKALHGRYTLCAASNAFYEQQKARLALAGFLPYFSQLFVSEQLGASKPDKAFFDACLAVLPGVAPQEAVMIGDSLTADVAGGHAAHLRTVWFNRTRAAVPSDCPADCVVTSLSAIPPLLSAQEIASAPTE